MNHTRYSFYTQSNYNTNLNIQRHSSNSILQHFSSGVKVGKAISNLLIGIRKPLFSPALLCLVNKTFKYFSLLISFVFLLTPLKLNLSFLPKRQQVLLLRPMIPSPAHSSLKRQKLFNYSLYQNGQFILNLAKSNCQLV